MAKKKTLLDLDRLPTLEEMQDFFKENDWSTAKIFTEPELIDAISHGKELLAPVLEKAMQEHGLGVWSGYPDKMEDFLQRNPGLRSRIAFHVPFADYNAEELCSIAKLIGKNKGLNLSADALEKLETLFDGACRQQDFGNGRYVRNILEQARMSQATRLMKADFDSITTQDITTIKAEDISEPTTKKLEKRRIGFIS